MLTTGSISKYGTWATVCAVVVFAAHPTHGSAQDADQRAKTHFQAGTSYFDTGEYELALREFMRAYDLSERPELFYNISLVYERLGQVGKAAEYLERYLEHTDQIANRRTLELRLRNLKERHARLQETDEKSEAVETQLYETETREDDTSPESVAHESETFAANEPTKTESIDTPASSQEGGLTTPVLASFIAAGVGAVTFATFGTMVLLKDGDFEDGCLARGTCSKGDLDRQDTFALLADIGLGVALAAGALGTVLWFTTNQGHEADPSSATPVAVSPWMSPQGGGAVANVRF